MLRVWLGLAFRVYALEGSGEVFYRESLTILLGLAEFTGLTCSQGLPIVYVVIPFGVALEDQIF